MNSRWLVPLFLVFSAGCERKPLARPNPPLPKTPAPQEEPPPPPVVWVPVGELLPDREFPKEAPETPRFSPDGRFLASLVWDDSDPLKMHQRVSSRGVVHDLQLQETRRFTLPSGHWGTEVLWCGDTLVVRAIQRLSGNSCQQTIWRRERGTDSLQPVLLQEREPFFELPLGLGRRLRLRFTELAPLTWIRMGERTEWLIESEFQPGKSAHPVLPVSIRILNRDGEVEADIPYRDTPTRARISPDGTRLLLVDGPHDYMRHSVHDHFRFEVYDLQSGELLWGGPCGDRRGLPALLNHQVYWLELLRPPTGPGAGDPQTVALMVQSSEQAREVLRLRLRPGETAGCFSASPQQDRIALQVDGARPRILIFPLREHVEPEDVRELRP